MQVANSDNKTIASHAAIYFLGLAAAQASTLLVLPYFARKFSSAEFGAYDISYVGAMFGSSLGMLGLDLAATHSYFNTDIERRKRAFPTALAMALVFNVILVAPFIALSPSLSRSLFDSDNFVKTVVWAAAWVPLIVVANMSRQALRAERRPVLFVVSLLIANYLSSILAIVLISAFNFGVEAIFIGYCVGAALSIAMNYAVSWTQLRPGYDRELARTEVKYGLPLMISSIAAWGLRSVDRFILVGFVSLRQVAIYGVANRIANLMMLVVSGFQLSWISAAIEMNAEDPEAELRARARIVRLWAVLLSFLAVGLSLGAPVLIELIAGDKYESSYKYVPLLCAALAMYGTASVLQTGFLANARTKAISKYVGVGIIVNVVACFALVPSAGILGASIADLLGYGALLIVTYRGSQRLNPIAYGRKQLTALCLITAVVLVVAALAPTLSFVGFVFRVGALVDWIALIWATRVLTENDLEMLKRLGRRRRSMPNVYEEDEAISPVVPQDDL